MDSSVVSFSEIVSIPESHYCLVLDLVLVIFFDTQWNIFGLQVAHDFAIFFLDFPDIFLIARFVVRQVAVPDVHAWRIAQSLVVRVVVERSIIAVGVDF